MSKARICSVEGCGKPYLARGFCRAHWGRWRKYGDPLGGGTACGEPERFFEEVVLAYEGDDCLTWPYAKSSKGYAHMRHEGETRLVSRLVCERVHGPAPTSDHEAAHSCGRGDQACVTKGHLSWKTPVGNWADRHDHGTDNRGVTNGRAKLTPENVREIRKLLADDMPTADVARRFAVDYGTIKQIVTGKAWGWLQ